MHLTSYEKEKENPPLIALANSDSYNARMTHSPEIRIYDVAQHLRTPREMALYLEACIEECGGDFALIAKALDDIVRAMRRKTSPVAV